MKATISPRIAELSGKEIFWITLENDKGASARVTNYGCIIQSITVPDSRGIFRDVTLGFDEVERYYSPDYLADSPYFGAIVGRYANRIANAEYKYQGKTYQLTRNDGNNQLHGGGSFSQKVWTIKSVHPETAAVVFSLESPDGEEGFPGNVVSEVTYQLSNDNVFIYDISGKTDFPTPMNMTNHVYFNLNADGSSVKDHLLEIRAHRYFAQDENLVVTGELLPVRGTQYDFSAPRPIGSNWNPETGYDQAFEIDKDPGKWACIAKASSAKTGITLEVHTAEPVVQFYSGGFLNGIKGKGGVVYNKFSGFCLETHHHPNAVNIPEFPDTILQPGKSYRQRTAFRFGTTS